VYKVLIDTRERYKKLVKLVRNGKVVSERSGDIDIAASIKEILDENTLSVSGVDEFVAEPGPGSFTGLKVGITTANVLNWVLKKKSGKELIYPNYGADPNIHKTEWLEK